MWMLNQMIKTVDHHFHSSNLNFLDASHSCFVDLICIRILGLFQDWVVHFISNQASAQISVILFSSLPLSVCRYFSWLHLLLCVCYCSSSSTGVDLPLHRTIRPPPRTKAHPLVLYFTVEWSHISSSHIRLQWLLSLLALFN